MNTNASDSTVGSRSLRTWYRCVHSSALPPAPSTFSAAKYSRMVPNSACAIPTEHRMKYFHAASRLAGVR